MNAQHSRHRRVNLCSFTPVRFIDMHGDFHTTHWSAVIDAGGGSSPEAQRALSSLCEIYWYPLYAYACRRVASTHEAQDLTQAFFAELLDKNYVAAATPERGKFRAFLLTAFKHFMAKQWEKQNAQKRGGGRAILSLDFASADSRLRIDPAAGLTPEQLYDQQWAIALLGVIMDRLQSEMEETGKGRQFDALKGYLVGDHEGTTYAAIAETIEMTEAAAKKAASRMRIRYRELLREEIAQTVNGPEAIENEIHNLFTAMSL